MSTNKENTTGFPLEIWVVIGIFLILSLTCIFDIFANFIASNYFIISVANFIIIFVILNVVAKKKNDEAGERS